MSYVNIIIEVLVSGVSDYLVSCDLRSKMEKPEASDVKTEVIISECPVLNVVVYKDRAEVTREIALQLEAGTQEVSEGDLLNYQNKP